MLYHFRYEGMRIYLRFDRRPTPLDRRADAARDPAPRVTARSPLEEMSPGSRADPPPPPRRSVDLTNLTVDPPHLAVCPPR